MAVNRHVIARQIFDLSFTRREDGYALQEKLSHIYWEKVVPALSDLFDRLSDPAVLIRIDSLEIDLGEIDLNQLESELSDRLVRALEAQLQELIWYGAGQLERIPQAFGYFEAWLHFLEKGVLPWNSAGLQEAELHEAVLSSIASEATSVNRFRQVLRQQPNAAERLVLQHDSDFLKQLAEAVSGRVQGNLLPIEAELRKAVSQVRAVASGESFRGGQVLANRLRHVYWQIVVERLADRAQSLLTAEVIRTVLASADRQRPADSLLTALVEAVRAKPGQFPELTGLLASVALPAGTEVSKEVKGPEPEEKEVSGETEGKRPAKDRTAPETGEELGKDALPTEDAGLEKPTAEEKGIAAEEIAPDLEFEERTSEPAEAEDPDPPRSLEDRGATGPDREKESVPEVEQEKMTSPDRESLPVEPETGEVLKDSALEKETESRSPDGRKDGDGAEKPATEPETEMPDKEGEELTLLKTEEGPEMGKTDKPEEPIASPLDTSEQAAGKEPVRDAVEEANTATPVEPELPVRDSGKEPADTTPESGEEEEKEPVAGGDPETSPSEADRKEAETPLYSGKEEKKKRKPGKKEKGEEQPETRLEKEAAPDTTSGKEETELIPEDQQKDVEQKDPAGLTTETPKPESSQPDTDRRDTAAPTEEKRQLPADEKESTPDGIEQADGQKGNKEDPGLEHTAAKDRAEVPSTKKEKKPEEGLLQESREEAPPISEESGPPAVGEPHSAGEETSASEESEAKSPKKGRKQKGAGKKEDEAPEKRKTEEAGEGSQEQAPDGEARTPETRDPSGSDRQRVEEEAEPSPLTPPPAPVFAEQPEGTTYYIRNAGVILVHPFLRAFFEGLDLVRGKAFRDEAARHKAVHLIEYLATGALEQPEYELVLPKFLCNLPLDVPLARQVDLSEAELAEGENLLQALISHWKAIGQSSPAALREGFLQREGKLERRANGWYLVVERITIDVLLDRLPWNVSMVKLPWMAELLRVEWG